MKAHKSKILLTQLIAAWDHIHLKDTGHLGFSDIVDAIELAGIRVENDIPGTQKQLDPDTNPKSFWDTILELIGPSL